MNDACKIESGSTEIFVVVEKPPTVPSNVLKKLDNYMDTMAKEAGKAFDAKVTIMLLFPAQGDACVWGINAEGGSLTDSQIEGILSILTLDEYKPAQQRTRKVNSRSTVTYEIEKGKVKEVKRSNLTLVRLDRNN
jgi:hypothetical protein